jgi:hypothetical protein
LNKYTWKLNVDTWSEWFAKHHDAVPSLISTDIELSITAENFDNAEKTLGSFIDKTFWDIKA